MAKAMKKISSTLTMLTVIGAIATAPAQAASLVNNDVINTAGDDRQNQVEQYDLKGDLLVEAKSTITALNQSNEVTETIIDGKNVYIYNSGNSSIARPELYSHTYSMPTPVRRKVPEPSIAPGLIVAAGIFATTRRQLWKRAL